MECLSDATVSTCHIPDTIRDGSPEEKGDCSSLKEIEDGGLQLSCSDAASDSADDIQVLDSSSGLQSTEVMDDSDNASMGLSLNLCLPQSPASPPMEELVSSEVPSAAVKQTAEQNKDSVPCKEVSVQPLSVEASLPRVYSSRPQTKQNGCQGTPCLAATSPTPEQRSLTESSTQEDYCSLIMEAELPVETISDTDSDLLATDSNGATDSDSIEVILVQDLQKDVKDSQKGVKDSRKSVKDFQKGVKDFQKGCERFPE